MSKNIRVGIIGCGGIAQTHLAALLTCPGVEIVALCDIVKDRAEAMAEKITKPVLDEKEEKNSLYASPPGDEFASPVYFQKPRVFENWKDFIQDSGVQSVHICTPHYLHAGMAIAAMQAGIHVLTEKPMAISLIDARRMTEVSKTTGSRLGVCFQNRYNKTSQRMRACIDSGEAGRVLGGRAFVTWQRGADYYQSGAWRGTWSEEGGGVAINQAIHTLDLLQWLLGTPVSIKGSMDTRLLGDAIEVEDTAEATIQFENGTTGLFYATNNYCTDAPVFLEIVCENLVMRLDDHLSLRFKDGREEKVFDLDIENSGKSYWGTGHQLLVQDWYRTMRKNQPFGIDGKAGLPALQLVLGIYESHKIRDWVSCSPV